MPNEYITMSDATTLTINTTDTLDLDINHHYGHTIDVSNITSSTIDTTIDFDLFTDDGITLTLNDPVEFEDHMPDVAKIEDMCNDYPALAKAYENFKSIYAMVHQDWKGRQEKDDQFPF